VKIACDQPGHRCVHSQGGRRCARVAVENGRCEVHPPSAKRSGSAPSMRRWTDHSILPRGGR
jgi:hypothetical protein